MSAMRCNIVIAFIGSWQRAEGAMAFVRGSRGPDNILVGPFGNDFITGDGGSDLLLIIPSFFQSGERVAAVTVTGGAGDDFLSFAGGPFQLAIEPINEVDVIFSGGDGSDTLEV